jgi:hypothetical protein
MINGFIRPRLLSENGPSYVSARIGEWFECNRIAHTRPTTRWAAARNIDPNILRHTQQRIAAGTVWIPILFITGLVFEFFSNLFLMFAVKNSDAGSRLRLRGTQTISKQARTAGAWEL